MSNVECRVPNEIQLTVELYGVLTRLAGDSSLNIAARRGATVADALDLLAQSRPDLAGVLPGCACAVGDAIVPRTRALNTGERIALLPPVSGG